MLAAGLLISVLYTASRPRGPRRSADFKKPVEQGGVLCPLDEGRKPADITGVKMNDFVIVKLISKDRSYVERTWGRVIGKSDDGELFLIELVTSLSESGLQSMRTDKHGFSLGERIAIGVKCIYDVLPQADQSTFTILCGIPLSQVTPPGWPLGKDKYIVPKEAFSVRPGDTVVLVIGSPSVGGDALPGAQWIEEIMVTVVSLGKTGDVIRGLVRSTPENPNHDLRRHNEVYFTRDCIVGVLRQQDGAPVIVEPWWTSA